MADNNVGQLNKMKEIVMGKSKNRASAVRKIDPATDQVIVSESDTAPVPVSVLGSETGSAVAVPKGVNPIAAAGHTIEVLSAEYKTKSGVIRFLASKGFETKHIAVWMGVRYQHVRNVLTTQLKKPVGATMQEPIGNVDTAGEPEAE